MVSFGNPSRKRNTLPGDYGRKVKIQGDKRYPTHTVAKHHLIGEYALNLTTKGSHWPVLHGCCQPVAQAVSLTRHDGCKAPSTIMWRQKVKRSVKSRTASLHDLSLVGCRCWTMGLGKKRGPSWIAPCNSRAKNRNCEYQWISIPLRSRAWGMYSSPIAGWESWH